MYFLFVNLEIVYFNLCIENLDVVLNVFYGFSINKSSKEI